MAKRKESDQNNAEPFADAFRRIVLEEAYCETSAFDEVCRERQECDATGLPKTLVDAGLLTCWQAERVATQILLESEAAPEIPGFTIHRFLARTGRIKTFLAHQESVARDVKLYVLLKDLQNNEPSVARFRRMAKLIASLNHKNIIGAIDLGETPECLYLVLQHRQGKTLANAGRLTRRELTSCACDLASALEHIHSEGLAHGNLCPEQIFITGHGRAHLSGFEWIEEEGSASESIPDIPPRYLVSSQKNTPSQQADLFAFGCLLYEAATGKNPLALRGESGPARLPKTLPGSFRLGWSLNSIAYALMRQSSGGYANCGSLLRDLERLNSGRFPKTWGNLREILREQFALFGAGLLSLSKPLALCFLLIAGTLAISFKMFHTDTSGPTTQVPVMTADASNSQKPVVATDTRKSALPAKQAPARKPETPSHIASAEQKKRQANGTWHPPLLRNDPLSNLFDVPFFRDLCQLSYDKELTRLTAQKSQAPSIVIVENKVPVKAAESKDVRPKPEAVTNEAKTVVTPPVAQATSESVLHKPAKAVKAEPAPTVTGYEKATSSAKKTEWEYSFPFDKSNQYALKKYEERYRESIKRWDLTAAKELADSLVVSSKFPDLTEFGKACCSDVQALLIFERRMAKYYEGQKKKTIAIQTSQGASVKGTLTRWEGAQVIIAVNGQPRAIKFPFEMNQEELISLYTQCRQQEDPAPELIVLLLQYSSDDAASARTTFSQYLPNDRRANVHEALLDFASPRQ